MKPTAQSQHPSPRTSAGRAAEGWAAGQVFEVPDGWVARGFVFEVETTRLEQPAQTAPAFGARRDAYNWALDQVKANLDARAADPSVPPLAWNFRRPGSGAA